MGFRCKRWSTQDIYKSVNSTRVLGSHGPGTLGKQWIVNATAGGRRYHLTKASKVVLDGGPRWVLSTALGFITGGLWWTIILLALIGLGNYVAYTSSEIVPWGSRDEWGGLIAYTILAAALSIASVPGEWKGLDWGLGVEMVLCVSVILSVAIMHSFFAPFEEENAGDWELADAGRWVIPALVWSLAYETRETATKVVETKLGRLWCRHPIAHLNASPNLSQWDVWASLVEECATRVGGYSMLGFKADDLAKLTDYSLGEKARKAIQTLGISISMDTGPQGSWVVESLPFKAGYDCRIRNKEPNSGSPPLPFRETQAVIRGLKSQHYPRVTAYQTKLEKFNSLKERYQERHGFLGNDLRLFYAGALIADSDQRERSLGFGKYGPRLAIAIALFAEGTDPLARLDCYFATKSEDSDERSLRRAISNSAQALVTKLAASADVKIDKDLLSERGLAYATGPAGSKQLSYSPDEMAAASHINEAIVISDDTFTANNTPIEMFETLWGGSDSVKKKVDVSDMVPLTASALWAGDSACRGWMCQVGFMLAILFAYATDNALSGFVSITLVAIAARKPKLRAHMKNHFYMIYISFILNYIRFFSRAVLLSPRGQASVDKAYRTYGVVLLFVNVLPAVACTIYSEGEWSVAFLPCMLSNVPGLLNTVWYGWKSAFIYEWWSWHVFNRWYAGRSYLRIEGLRKRVGKNVLSVNVDCNRPRKVAKRVLPLGGEGVRFMVIGG